MIWVGKKRIIWCDEFGRFGWRKKDILTSPALRETISRRRRGYSPTKSQARNNHCPRSQKVLYYSRTYIHSRKYYSGYLSFWLDNCWYTKTSLASMPGMTTLGMLHDFNGRFPEARKIPKSLEWPIPKSVKHARRNILLSSRKQCVLFAIAVAREYQIYMKHAITAFLNSSQCFCLCQTTRGVLVCRFTGKRIPTWMCLLPRQDMDWNNQLLNGMILYAQN